MNIKQAYKKILSEESYCFYEVLKITKVQDWYLVLSRRYENGDWYSVSCYDIQANLFYTNTVPPHEDIYEYYSKNIEEMRNVNLESLALDLDEPERSYYLYLSQNQDKKTRTVEKENERTL